MSQERIKLDTEEKALLKSIEAGGWQSIDNLSEEIVRARKTATNTLRKENNL